MVVLFRHHDVRLRRDQRAAQFALAADARVDRAISKIERPVQIEAFISPSVPEAYVQTRLNLLTMLEELQALGGEKLQVQIHDTERYSDEAALAEKRYGIEPRQVTTLNHGALSRRSHLPQRGGELRHAEGAAGVHRPRHARSSTSWSARSAP